MMFPRSLITAAAGAGVLLLASEAHAATFTFCIRLPVTIGDEVGSAADLETELGLPANTLTVNEAGTTGDWRARGIRIETLKRNGVAVPEFTGTFANSGTGCFTQSVSVALGGSSNWTIGVKSHGELSGNNALRAHNTSGVTSYYEATANNIPNMGGTFNVVWPNEYILLRMYAILAYAIEEGFRGEYANQTLRAWWSADGAAGNSPCGCDDATSYTACACSSGGYNHVTVQNWLSNDRFVLGHEYGHHAISATLADPGDFPNSCGSYHDMTSFEWNSCAAMEGWAHLVGVDSFTTDHHSGGEPPGWFRYFGDPIDAAGEWDPSLTCSDYRDQFADNCGFGQFQCQGGDCDQVGVELDWMRTWWDYHTSGNLPGSLRSHPQLQADIEASGGWASNTAWDEIKAGMVSRGTGTRWQDAGDDNGSSEPQ